MKKGQTEMIGLVIVVVILVIGALFYVKNVLEQQAPKKDAVVEVSYAGNLLNSIVNVNVCDGKYSFSDGLTACYNGLNFCEKEACNYMKLETKAIMGLVGYKDPKKYSFWVENNGNTKYINNDCKFGTKVDIKVAKENDEVYQVNLKLC